MEVVHAESFGYFWHKFTGFDYHLVPIHDVVGLQVRVYKRLHLAVIYMSAYTNFSIMVLNT